MFGWWKKKYNKTKKRKNKNNIKLQKSLLGNDNIAQNL